MVRDARERAKAETWTWTSALADGRRTKDEEKCIIPPLSPSTRLGTLRKRKCVEGIPYSSFRCLD
jgi:hypothetical protein